MKCLVLPPHCFSSALNLYESFAPFQKENGMDKNTAPFQRFCHHAVCYTASKSFLMSRAPLSWLGGTAPEPWMSPALPPSVPPLSERATEISSIYHLRSATIQSLCLGLSFITSPSLLFARRPYRELVATLFTLCAAARVIRDTQEAMDATDPCASLVTHFRLKSQSLRLFQHVVTPQERRHRCTLSNNHISRPLLQLVTSRAKATNPISRVTEAQAAHYLSEQAGLAPRPQPHLSHNLCAPRHHRRPQA